VGKIVGKMFLSSARSVQNITKPGYHRAGPGLYLQVSGKGTKSWLYRYKSPITGKQREMGLGSAKFISLAEARELAHEHKRSLIYGQDPLIERKKARVQRQLDASRDLPFRDVAQLCIDTKKPEWSNKKSAQQWENTIATYALPIIGDCSISEIDTDLVLKVLIPIWTKRATTAQRIRQRIETIWDFAKARGLVEGENPAKLKGHLENLLPKTEKIKKVRHHPALPYQDVSEFIANLRERTGVSALALEFLILTATRTGDVIGAKHSEVDLEKATWTIPAERFKTRKEFRVPLCDRAIELINLSLLFEGRSEFLFPGQKSNSGLSNGAFLSLHKKMNYGHITPHGFRSTFRDWVSEEAIEFSNETAELALGHTIKNQAEAAYRRGDQLDRRRDLMDRWSNFLSS